MPGPQRRQRYLRILRFNYLTRLGTSPKPGDACPERSRRVIARRPPADETALRGDDAFRYAITWRV